MTDFSPTGIPAIDRNRAPRRYRPALVGLLVIGLTVAAACSSGSSPSAGGEGGIVVIDARIPVPANPDIAAVYMQIANEGGRADTLEAVRTDAGGTATLHRTEIVDGVAHMSETGPVTIEAGETLSLDPGGHHVMIMDPETTFDEGDRVEVTLVFEHAGEVPVEAVVVDPATIVGGDHHADHHDGGGDDDHHDRGDATHHDDSGADHEPG